MYENKLWVFDNIIDQQKQNLIESIWTGVNFPWFFVKNVTGPFSPFNRPSLQHNIVFDSKKNSSFLDYVLPIIDNSCKKIKFKYKDILRVKTFLQFPLNLKDYTMEELHIDDAQKHLVVLYYVLSSDGKTVIYDRDNKTILKSIKPKKGRVVIFDGSYYHTSEHPKENMRSVINCNLS